MAFPADVYSHLTKNKCSTKLACPNIQDDEMAQMLDLINDTKIEIPKLVIVCKRGKFVGIWCIYCHQCYNEYVHLLHVINTTLTVKSTM